MTDVAANLWRVHERIDAAAARAGRDPAEVLLVAVSKTVEPSRIVQAYEAGVRDFGENRVQEAEQKLAELRHTPLPGVRWHLIGRLQTNKVKPAVRLFDIIHSVDSLHLAQALARQAAAAGKTLHVLLEVNVAGEASKAGLRPDEVLSVAGEILKLPGLRVEGLMTVAPLVADPEEVRPVFRQLRELRARLREGLPQSNWPRLSMGMTDDFEVAVEEGATMVRIGRAVFGERRN